LFGHKWVHRDDDLWECNRCHVISEKVCVGYEMGTPFFEYIIVVGKQ